MLEFLAPHTQVKWSGKRQDRRTSASQAEAEPAPEREDHDAVRHTALRLPDTAPSSEVDPRLDALRRLASRSRLAPRADLDRACELLRVEPEQAAEAYALAFVRAAASGLGRPMRFHRPGVETMTFDEAWAMRLIDSLIADDLVSATFCLASRLPRYRRATVRFLAAGLAHRLDGASLEGF